MTNQKSKTTTEELIASGFKELALTIPIDKITIQEIADKAGVIRPTFYNHFEDKYDLLRWIMDKELFEPVLPMYESGFFYEGLTVIFTNALKSKDFYMQVAKLENPYSFRDIIENMMKEKLLYFIKLRIEKEAAQDKWFALDDVAEYYAQSMCFVAIKWIRRGMDIAPSDIVKIYRKIITNSLEDMLIEYEHFSNMDAMKNYIKI